MGEELRLLPATRTLSFGTASWWVLNRWGDQFPCPGANDVTLRAGFCYSQL